MPRNWSSVVGLPLIAMRCIPSAVVIVKGRALSACVLKSNPAGASATDSFKSASVYESQQQAPTLPLARWTCFDFWCRRVLWPTHLAKKPDVRRFESHTGVWQPTQGQVDAKPTLRPCGSLAFVGERIGCRKQVYPTCDKHASPNASSRPALVPSNGPGT